MLRGEPACIVQFYPIGIFPKLSARVVRFEHGPLIDHKLALEFFIPGKTKRNARKKKI